MANSSGNLHITVPAGETNVVILPEFSGRKSLTLFNMVGGNPVLISFGTDTSQGIYLPVGQYLPMFPVDCCPVEEVRAEGVGGTATLHVVVVNGAST